MEIYQVLKADHKVVKSLLKQLDDTTERGVKLRKTLLEKLKLAVVPHARAEEKVLYGRLKKSEVKEADALAFEGFEEHAVVDHLFDELGKTDPSDKRFTALLSVLKESLEHHIKEEENDVFKKAKRSFKAELAKEMTDEFNSLKAEYLTELKSGKKLKQPPSHEEVG